MLGSLRLLDRILRGEMTRPSQLEEGRFTFPIRGVSFIGLLLAMLYGACMGGYSLMRASDQLHSPESYRQLLASTLKTPALFFLTLVITFPSLYVFNALVGSRLLFGSVLRLLIASLGVNLAVLASFGPIVAFFSLSTNSYGFMVLLNVALFAVAGGLGLIFLLQTLNRLQYAQAADDLVANAGAEPRTAEEALAVGSAPRRPWYPPLPTLPGPIDRIEGHFFGRHVRIVFGIWIFVFGIVGAQMGWILRPFVGSPSEEFTWLRPRESNFFEAVTTTFVDTVFGGRSSEYPSSNESSRQTRRPEAMPAPTQGSR
ncbi:MAG: hypothetical protein K8U03_20105 [Planctomycetia bacterium]|nr:hypothetical protein [Planctomycetia bacterium]